MSRQLPIPAKPDAIASTGGDLEGSTNGWELEVEGLWRGPTAEDARADVVFIHGLDAHWEQTWRHPDASESWMGWLGRDAGSVNVFAIDYSVAKSSWNGVTWPLADRAEHMLLTLEHGLKGHLPLILIGHSMGGLHAKKMIEIATQPGARAEWQAVVERIQGVAFFATPHEGSDLASWVYKLPRFLIRQSVAIEDLRAHSAQLRELDQRFRSFVTKRRTPLLAFHETEKTARGSRLGRFFKVMVVDEDSANPKIDDVPCIPAAGDHSTMCQFVDDKRIAYRAVLQFVRGFFGDPHAISKGKPPVPTEPAVIAAVSAAVLGRTDSTNFYALGIRPNPYFVGREDKLEELRKAMFPKESAVHGRPIVLAQGFVGEGGIGKSQLAQRFAEQSCAALGGGKDDWNLFDAAWWLDCAAATHTQSVRIFAEFLGHRATPEETASDLRRVVRQRLSDGRRHFLVLDNLEVLPQNKGAADVDGTAGNDGWSIVRDLTLATDSRVILTTREKHIPGEVGSVVKLAGLSQNESRTLLRSARADLTGGAHDTELDQIFDLLRGHALATDMARAWLAMYPGESPRALLAQLRASDEASVRLLSAEELQSQAGRYGRSVAATLGLHTGALAGTSAEQVLLAAAFCAPDAIPGDLLRDATNLSQDEARSALAALAAKSILHHEPGPFGGAVHIHRLMQATVRSRAGDMAEAALKGLLDALVALFQWPTKQEAQAVDHLKTPERIAAIAHAESVLGHAERHFAAIAEQSSGPLAHALVPRAEGLTPALTSNMARLRAELARRLQDVGQLTEAMRHIDATIVWRENQNPRDNRSLAIDHSTRASLRLLRGELAGAEQDIAWAIDWECAQEQPNDHELAIRYTLRARIRKHRGELAGAELDIARSIEWGEKQNPRNERSLAIDYASRSGIRQHRGDLAGAELDIARSIEWGEKQNSRDEQLLAVFYVSRARIREDQALAARRTGDDDAARRLFESAKTEISACRLWWEKNRPADERALQILRSDQARIERAVNGE